MMKKKPRICKLFIMGVIGIAILVALPMVSFSESEIIKVNYYENFTPLSLKKDGQMHGILVESLNAVLVNRLGKKLVHNGYPWARAQALVKAGKADAIITNPTEDRKTYAYFTEMPFVTSYVVILTGINNPRREEIDQIETIEDLRNFRQVDHRGNGWAKKWFKDLEINWVNSLQQAIKLLQANRFDIFVGNGLVVKALVHEMNLKDKIMIREVYKIAKPGKFHFGLRKTFPNAEKIINDIDKALVDAKSNGEIERIVARYIE